MLIDHQELRAIATRIFEAGRSAAGEARIVADHLVEANLRGHDSHGVGMIPGYLKNLRNGTLKPNSKGRIASEREALLVYDGERGYGQVVAREATLVGIARAKSRGLALVALRNAHHIGRVGTYGELCAEAGLVSIHFVNVLGHGPTVAPYRGADGRLLTNPICIAMPAAEPGRPMILDMATSKVALGKVRVARNEKRRVKAGLLIDAKGKPTTDPKVMFREPKGAILSMGEHKGYALAFACDLLAGALGGAGTLRPENQMQDTITNGMLTFVIDPERLVARDYLMDEIRAITRYVTASPARKKREPVLIPGDPERATRAERMRDGISLDRQTWRDIVEGAASLGVKVETKGKAKRR
ncbi:MAG TPA: malate/lactate/ureidoglycolate dehydrogenase [Alphaproteobacteria bacterium]|nr:malate/lactate/ureidoglycolate dehydrogenase [Alphaproteobacteria bacterium]